MEIDNVGQTKFLTSITLEIEKAKHTKHLTAITIQNGILITVTQTCTGGTL